MFVSGGLVEQHIHGAFGYDFMTCTSDELYECSNLLLECGVSSFFPTIMTEDINVIKDRIQLVKSVMNKQQKDAAQIAGVHLEGPFINPEKHGIHEVKYILPLEKQYFEQIDDDIIKIVTLAPELSLDGNFIQYLHSNGIKISAGHTMTHDLSMVDQVTHLYNAMGAFSHREPSAVVRALSDNIYTEIIADSMHVSDEVLKLTFKLKPIDKILLISDALPLAHSSKPECIFAGQTIYNKDGKLLNKEGVFAGSSKLLCDIVKNLADKNILSIENALQAASFNQLNYHKLNNNIKVYWNGANKIEKVEII